MAASEPLFTLPVPLDSHKSLTKGTGSFVCTSPAPKVYLLAFSSPPDNRLTPDFNRAFLLSLDIIEHRFPKGVVVTTSAIPKFYSNGLDLQAAMENPAFWVESLQPLWKRLLTYPMPTVALINGHAFAGGFMTAMMHDYRIQNPQKGFLCLNELEFGAPLRNYMASIFRVKVANVSILRNIVLHAHRYGAQEALKEGIIDAVGGAAEALAFISEQKLVQKAQSPAYGLLKAELYREVVQDLENSPDPLKVEETEKQNSEAEKRLGELERLTGKKIAKL